MPLSVLIVDDHVAVQQGLSRILAAEFNGAEFAYATNGADAVSTAMKQAWSLIVLDLSIPGRGGLEFIGTLREVCPAARILIYTMHPESQFGLRCVRAGAHGYLTKDAPGEALIQAVNRLCSGKRYVSVELADLLASAFAARSTAGLESLSNRELQILHLMAAGDTGSAIAMKLHLSVKTISTYRRRILEKLNLRTNADLVRYAVESGLTE